MYIKENILALSKVSKQVRKASKANFTFVAWKKLRQSRMNHEVISDDCLTFVSGMNTSFQIFRNLSHRWLSIVRLQRRNLLIQKLVAIFVEETNH